MKLIMVLKKIKKIYVIGDLLEILFLILFGDVQIASSKSMMRTLEEIFITVLIVADELHIVIDVKDE